VTASSIDRRRTDSVWGCAAACADACCNEIENCDCPFCAKTDTEIAAVYGGYDLGDGDCRLIVFSGPQLSLFEMRSLSQHFAGRKVAPGTSVFVTTSNGVLSAADKLGYLKPLEDAGVAVLEGVCFYILQNLSPMRERNGCRNMVSNSAKIVNIIGAHKFRTILRRTEDCVEIACTGMLR